MNREQAKAYCLSKPEACLEYPFGPEVAVIKIRGKIFALVPEAKQSATLPSPVKGASVPTKLSHSISLKCEPHRAQALRDIYPAITGGYHFNKKHWNTVLLDGSVPASEIESQIDHSFCLVFSGLKKADRQALILRFGESALGLH